MFEDRGTQGGAREAKAGAPAPDPRTLTPDLRPPSPDPQPRFPDPRSPAPDPHSSTGLDPRTAAALAYLAGPFSGVLVLWAEMTNRDVRFHAWQSILGLGGLALGVCLSGVLALVALFVSATAMLVMLRLATAFSVVLVIVWAICLWKAFAGGRWKLPLVGDHAERRASARA